MQGTEHRVYDHKSGLYQVKQMRHHRPKTVLQLRQIEDVVQKNMDDPSIPKTNENAEPQSREVTPVDCIEASVISPY